MKHRVSIACLSLFLVFTCLTFTPGCGKRSAAAEGSNLSLEEKIKRVESSDLPGPVKDKAIQELRAKQGRTGQAE
jgi:hypothetical protein